MIRRIRSIITIILLIYLAYIANNLFWQFLAKENKQIPATVVENVQKSQRIPLNLFGREVKPKPKAKKSYAKVKKTKLDVELIGIISNTKQPFAIIKLANSKNQAYTIGDKISGIAEIKEIKDDFIIINHNDKDEKLTIERKVSHNITKKINTKVANKNTFDSLSDKEKLRFKEYLKSAKQNPQKLLDIVRVKPNVVGSTLDGFIVYPAKEKEIFDKIGFKSGDIILEVNGTKLDNLSDALKIGKDLTSQNEFSFAISRSGVNTSIYINLN